MSELLPCVEVNPQETHDAVVIWLHGLGDSGNGFAPIVPELGLPASHRIRFVFPHAPVRPITINNNMPMRAWYDIKSLDFNQRADMEGVLASAEQVETLIEHEIAKGIASERIVLAGFSQGGVIAYHVGLRLQQKLAGIMALSTYMAEPESLQNQRSEANKDTEIFCAHGEHDDVVPVFMGNAAYKVVEQNGYKAQWHSYPMQHNVCAQEVADIATWLTARLG